MKIAVLGIDLGKNVCSVVGLDASGDANNCSVTAAAFAVKSPGAIAA